MRIQALHDVPYLGKKGTIKNIADSEAKVLILLNQARAVGDTTRKTPRKTLRKKRTYKRRDMRAEIVTIESTE